MTINTKTPRTLAALKLPRKIGDLINIAQVVVKAMTGNPNFPNPQPTVAVMTAAVNDLVAAENAAKIRTTGAVALRNAKKQALVTLLERGGRSCSPPRTPARRTLRTSSRAGAPRFARTPCARTSGFTRSSAPRRAR